ncbi:hypothetical protein CDO45_10640 [Pseudomonas aeruginosa]|nr:hypothetical protein APA84_33105 [Pseudomonas aeruginosa]OVZ17962.1 hypothetical protein CDO45_10640 [Pseudomonas aeruginosa]
MCIKQFLEVLPRVIEVPFKLAGRCEEFRRNDRAKKRLVEAFISILFDLMELSRLVAATRKMELDLLG